VDDIWSEYPTIATHPTIDDLRLVRHPNGPAIVHDRSLSTVEFAVRLFADQHGAKAAGQLAQWIAFALAGAR
jgi:hypothetical protein